MNNIKQIIIAVTLSLVIYSCSTDKEAPGSEYMPDMGHSIAMEANVLDDYYYNTWDKASTISMRDLYRSPGLPVKGSVARGYAGVALGSSADMDGQMGKNGIGNMRISPNGSVPYYYADNDSARLMATAEILDNPFPITAEGLARGKELYNIMCGICHGEKANGLGYLYDADSNPNAKYLAAPANLVNEEFQAASNGRFYHAIMYGKNVMGGYSDKISYEERWQVIHYIRSLQAKEAGAVYSEESNTYNAAFGIPGASMPAAKASTAMLMEEVPTEEHPAGEHHSDNGHH